MLRAVRPWQPSPDGRSAGQKKQAFANEGEAALSALVNPMSYHALTKPHQLTAPRFTVPSHRPPNNKQLSRLVGNICELRLRRWIDHEQVGISAAHDCALDAHQA